MSRNCVECHNDGDEMEGLGSFIVKSAEILAGGMREQAAATRDLAAAVQEHS